MCVYVYVYTYIYMKAFNTFMLPNVIFMCGSVSVGKVFRENPVREGLHNNDYRLVVMNRNQGHGKGKIRETK